MNKRISWHPYGSDASVQHDSGHEYERGNELPASALPACPHACVYLPVRSPASRTACQAEWRASERSITYFSMQVMWGIKNCMGIF